VSVRSNRASGEHWCGLLRLSAAQVRALESPEVIEQVLRRAVNHDRPAMEHARPGARASRKKGSPSSAPGWSNRWRPLVPARVSYWKT
jgi:hypothetical protein